MSYYKRRLFSLYFMCVTPGLLFGNRASW